MKLFWIQEVRYYKYAVAMCIFLIFMGCILMHEYLNQENNSGIIINTQIIHNITYTFPIYRVQKNNTIYIMYEHCIIENIHTCNQTHYTANMIVYFEKINGYYIIMNRNNLPLYFSVFAFVFSILMLLIISYAYYDFNKLRRKEYSIWSKQKKYDLDMYIENGPSSFLFY
jgi:hypothetical protein